MLELINLAFVVEDKKIIDDINLKIDTNSFVVITGPNGSGKSTLAKLIMGIELPTSGKIKYNGKDITNLSVDERAKLGISFSFQQPIRFKGITTYDLLNIASGKVLNSKEICEILSSVGLPAYQYLYRELDDSLSGGEIKRIEIASLIARDTKLSLFDEPEAGIDIWSFNNLIRVFNKLRLKHDSTIIVISHQERILEIADQIIILEQGTINKIGTSEEILPTLHSCCCNDCERCVYDE
jgi:Fe-S cluster assembly ATP-binding protein